MRSHKKGKKTTFLYSNGNKCLISNKSFRLCDYITFCSNTMSEICISSQLRISQGYWNDMTHQSRQHHKQCFSPFLVPLFSQKHSCIASVTERWGGRESRQCTPTIPPESPLVNGGPLGAYFEWTDARAASGHVPNFHSECEQKVPWDWGWTRAGQPGRPLRIDHPVLYCGLGND